MNVFRPMSEAAEKLLKLKDDMERFARQNVTGSVNNSNLLSFASAGDLRRGYDVIRDASDISGIHVGIHVVHTTGRENILKEFLAGGCGSRHIGKPIPLAAYMQRDVDTFARSVSMSGSLGRMH